MKQIITLLLWSLFFITTTAQDFAIKNEKDQILYFKIISEENKELSLVRGKYKYNDSNYIIPKAVEYNNKEYTVVEIGDKAFYERDNLKSIILPNTIKYIGEDAFEDCIFSSFIFPDSLKAISNNPFGNTIISRSGLSKILGELVGKYYTNKYVKGGYRIYEATPISVIFKNDVTNVKKELTDLKDLETKLFKDDFKSFYMPVLTKVERTDNPEDRYGGISEVNKEDVSWFRFSDENIDFEISGTISTFNFLLTNKTSNTIKMVWDDAVFVHVNGNTSKVMHNGIKYSERNNAQVASTIIRKSKLTDAIVPVDFVSYSESLREWITVDDLPESDIYEGKTVSVMLPIQIKDVINEYILEFTLLYKPLHPERLTR